LRSGPFEGPAIVKPPALPGDTYFASPEGEEFPPSPEGTPDQMWMMSLGVAVGRGIG